MANEYGEASSPSAYYLHLILSIITIISFWCQSIVTEERLVPALNVLADHYSIPDDVAGATLMAAGASSPELLCTLVSLFVTHSSLGLGTIVGSEIFNQLVICAGSVYATNSKVLVLDRRMVIREVGFYALSIALMYVALSDSHVDGDDGDDNGNGEADGEIIERIYVSFWKAALLFGGYILYVIVCANMDFVEKCIIQKLMRVGKGGIDYAANHENNRAHGCRSSENDNSTNDDYQLQIIDDNDTDLGFSLDKCTSIGSVHYKVNEALFALFFFTNILL